MNDHILLIHSNPAALRLFKEQVGQGYDITLAEGTAEAAALMASRFIDVIICENEAIHGAASFLQWVQERLPQTVIVVLSSWSDLEMALEGLERALDIQMKLEREYPGITRLKLDSKGFLILGDR